MTQKIILFLAVALSAFALEANAVPTKIKFQENGDIGPTAVFDSDGFDLTLSAFLTTGGTTNLFVKDEAGTTGDISGQNGIGTNTFIQLTLPTSPISNLDSISINHIAAGETALIYFTQTAGSLIGATLIGTLDHNGQVPIGSLFQDGFIDITAGPNSSVLLNFVRCYYSGRSRCGDYRFLARGRFCRFDRDASHAARLKQFILKFQRQDAKVSCLFCFNDWPGADSAAAR